MKKATFCDLDETLYPGSTIKDVNSWFFRQKYLPASTFGKVIWWLVLRQLGLLDHDQAFRDGVELLAGWDEQLLKDRLATAYQEVVRPRIRPEIRDLVRAWQTEGPVIIATESLDVIAAPLVADLGIDALLATKLEIAHRRVTGRLASEVLFARAKNRAILAYARQHEIDLSTSRGVGSRTEDRPLLELVGQPVMLNPNAAAAALAAHRRWSILRV